MSGTAADDDEILNYSIPLPVMFCRTLMRRSCQYDISLHIASYVMIMCYATLVMPLSNINQSAYITCVHPAAVT